MDYVFTVCDQAAGEVCPIWPGHPMTAHWGIPDPAAAEGTEAERMLAFREAFRMLERRIRLFLALQHKALGPTDMQREVAAIGRLDPPRRSIMSVTIYHNPDCGTSRNVLGLIRNSGEEPHVIEYLKTPPARAELVELIGRMGISVRDLLRRKGTPYDELGLDDPTLTDDQLIDAMMAHPILINRPIVVTPKGVKLCRPSETVLDLLPQPQRGAFAKEDGEAVVMRRQPGREARAMSEAAAVGPGKAPSMGVFERYLTLWVALCIVAGIALGQLLPGAVPRRRPRRGGAGQPAGRGAGLADDRADAAQDRLRARSARCGRHWRGIGVTLFINWAVKPFSMALLGWLFIGHLFRALAAGRTRSTATSPA